MSEHWNRVRHFLDINQDDEQAYLRVILYIISATALVATGIVAVTSIFIGFENVTMATAVACAISSVMLVLTWRGILLWPRIIFPVLAFATATYLVVVGDGIRDEGMYIYPLTIVLAGLLLGRTGVVVYTLLSMLTIAGIVYGEINGLIVNNFSDHTSYFNLIVFCALLTFMGILLYVTINSLTNSLRRSRQNESKLAESNRELQSVRASLEDEVAQRTQSAEAARQAAEEANWALEAQMWQLAGQANLSHAMRGDQDLPTLASRVIQQICQHLGAHVGTLYLKEGNLLKMVGRYTHQGQVTSFKIGEGLVGQAAMDQRAILVDEIPDGALKVASGLGETAPRHILAAPFTYEGHLVGVVEIGSLYPIGDTHIAFIEQVAESVAMAFNTARARFRIDELLAETQIQTEELQLREEELRALNEELETQSEKLRLQQEEG